MSSSQSSGDFQGKVLIVDDEPEVVELTCMGIEGSGYHAAQASNGQEALQLLEQPDNGIEVVILDQKMPVMSGQELLQKIREKGIPVEVIMVTGHGDLNDAITSLRNGAYHFLLKPVNFETLLHTVKQALEKRKSESELVEKEQLLAEKNALLKERLEAEKNIEQALIIARQANESKDQFLAMMSHELRTPLSSVIGYIEILQEKCLDSDQGKILQTISSASKSVLYLVNDLLDISKIRTGKFGLTMQPFDLRSTVVDVQQMFANQASIKEVEFGSRFGGEEKLIHKLEGDSVRISQILFNLLSNAIKFTASGGRVALNITVSDVTAGQQQVSFAVVDSGIGIPAERKHRVFQPFEQVDNSISRRFGGTGLGLYVSRSLVELMGGSIEFESVEGEGTTFTVTIPFPVTDQPASGPDASQGGNQYRKTTPVLQGRVLIAEDTPHLQQLLKRLVESTGAAVDVAENGEVALNKALSSPYDLILMDMHMPVMDGIEATRKLTESDMCIPVYALTADIVEKNLQNFLDAGCKGVITKPVSRDELYQVLAEELPAATVVQETRAEELSAVTAVQETRVDEVPDVDFDFDDDDFFAPAAEDADEFDDVIDEEMAATFHAFFAEAIVEIDQSYQRQDWQALYKSVHALTGTGTSFGFPQMTTLCREIEGRINAREYDGIDALIMQLKVMGDAILQ